MGFISNLYSQAPDTLSTSVKNRVNTQCSDGKELVWNADKLTQSTQDRYLEQCQSRHHDQVQAAQMKRLQQFAAGRH